MKTKIIHFILLIGLISCDTVGPLDELPPNNLVEGNLFVTRDDALAVLRGAYLQLADESYYTGIITIPALGATSLRSLSSVPGSFSFLDNLTGGEGEDLYASCYQLINVANHVIQGVQNMEASQITEETRREILGEAYFLRALGHFDVLRFFGYFFDFDSKYGVILREVPFVLQDKDKARSTVEESYQHILTDLELAIENISLVSEKYYANKITVYALQARVLLYMAAAKNHDTETYSAASLAAEQALSLGNVMLDDYESIFNGMNSAETIFEINNAAVGLTAPRNTIFEFFYFPADEYINFMTGDPRENTILSNAFGQTVVNKYSQRDILILFRAAELFLIKSEAQARIGNNTSLSLSRDALNAIRQQRGVELIPNTVNTPEELLNLIHSEIRKDFAFEGGHEWFSLVRLGLDAVQDRNSAVASEALFMLGIPERELQFNALCEQNPGYPEVGDLIGD